MTLALTVTVTVNVTVTVTFLTLALTGSSYGNYRTDVEQVYYAYIEQGFNYEIVAFHGLNSLCFSNIKLYFQDVPSFILYIMLFYVHQFLGFNCAADTRSNANYSSCIIHTAVN